MSTAPQDLSRRVLGWGLAAPLITPDDIGRDVVLVRRDNNGALDLGCLTGATNLGQDLAMALTTALGADPFNTGFGFDGLRAFVDEIRPALVRERLRASVAKTVAADPRVRSVISVDVSPSTSGNDRTLTLEVSVDTVVGAQTSIATPIVG
jgi:hypothetical protein